MTSCTHTGGKVIELGKKPRKKHTRSKESLVGVKKVDKQTLKEWHPSDEERYAVKMMVAGGMKLEDIARCIHSSGLPIPLSTLRNKFVQELKHGKANITREVVSVMTRMALSGKHPACTMFWLKAQAGWRDSVGGSAGNTKFGTQVAETDAVVKKLQITAKLAADTLPKSKTGTNGK